MSEGRNGSGGGLLIAFFVGAAAGAVVALLTTPKNGREMRESVASWAKKSGVRDAVTRAARATRDAFEGERDS
jgi:gas vesicle protein